MSLIDLVRALFFGNEKYTFKFSNNLLINQLYIDIEQIINIKETVKQGGLFQNHIIISQDINDIINYIECGNRYFLDHCKLKNEFPLELKSNIMRNFFYELSRACRGDLNNGILSNNFKKDDIPIPSYSDEETLQLILKNKNDYYLTFKNAEYWGIIAKKLLYKERPYTLTTIHLSVQYFRDILRLYDIKCKSLGNIINPYSFILTKYDSFVDPIHWQSVESLKLYFHYYPKSSLSQTCLELINLIITALMTANDDLLPKNILKDEIQLRKFIKNVENIHNRLDKVDSSNIPLKLIDVFHRLLAHSKLDYLWTILHLEETKYSSGNNILINMYLKNVELEQENKLLREEIIRIKKMYHANL